MIRSVVNSLVLAAFIGSADQVSAVEISSGLWYATDRSGHGLDIQRAGDQFTVMFFTFGQDEEPEWYLAVASMDDGVLSGDWGFFEYDAARTPPQQRIAEPGGFTISLNGGDADSICEGANHDASAVFDWTIGDEVGSWCIEPLLEPNNRYQQDFTGLWYAGQEDQGWGLALDYQGDGDSRTEVGILFYYDANGFPRWVYGQGEAAETNTVLDLVSFLGYCRSCDFKSPVGTQAGELRHALQVNEGAIEGRADVDIVYPQDPGGQWLRSDSPLVMLSTPEPGLLPMPEALVDGQTIAIVDTTLVPMTSGFPILGHRTVLVQDGKIVQITPADAFEIAADTVAVDGRGLFLAPGMTEMHLHISVGGQQAAEEAGLLMIANGITTALNMGNSFRFEVPLLSDRFAANELIGPRLYSGQVAYGPTDNSNATLTVSSPAEATEYAERLSELGYNYIKTYWRLAPNVIRQFQQDGERLGLPIVGHIPLTLPADTLLRDGQKMAAHIQEPFVTIMNSVRDEQLFQRAADILLRHGTYLTPTLAVFESYSSITGNMRENYESLIARDGNQYTHPAIRTGWENYFNSAGVQNANHQNLMELTEFYKKMTRFFFDAGVPLLNGTDAPGFPGVMSGFGAHEEMKLLLNTGIPADEVFAIATRNAGRFVDETLAPEAGFGTVEVGKRADLILVDRNPLQSIEHLKRPIAVMSTGRFWSKVFLDRELEKLVGRAKQHHAEHSGLLTTDDHALCVHH